MSAFSENLKRLRVSNNLSMDEIVSRLNSKYTLRFTKTTWARWESGETSPSIDHASAIADYFGLTLDELNRGLKGKNEIKPTTVETIAAHIDDDVTEEEMENIRKYIDFIKSQRK